MQLGLSRLRVAGRDRATQLRHDGGILAGLVRDVLFATVVTAALVAAVEAIAIAAGHKLDWGMLFLPADPDGYGGFVGAAVGAEAGLLALFFATVGVIASTAYVKVPGEIRQLFVRERTNLLYVWNVAVALLVGLVVLTMPLVAHRWPHGLTVLLFAVLTAFSVLSLAVLGTRLFNFFDLSTLSLPLRRRFQRGVKAASAAGRRSVPREAQQQAAHDRAAAVLQIYGQLTDLIEARDVTEGRAAERIALELLGCWQVSSAIKPTIPTKSKWFSLAPSYPNWLTLGHTQLTAALATATSAPPTMTPDPLWAENLIAGYVGRLLRALSTHGDWQRAIRVVDAAADLTFYLAASLQVDEARLLRRTIIAYLHDVLGGCGPDASDEGSGTRAEMFRMAAADRAVLIYTRFWLGLIQPFQQADSQQLASAFDKAVVTIQSPYKVSAPRQLLEMFERLAYGIGFEQRTEHQQVTPDWWVHHIAARTLLQMLITAVRDFFAQVQSELITPIVAATSPDAPVVATQVLGCLELVHKLAVHLQTAQQAVAALNDLRHGPTKDELWPDTSLPGDVQALEERLYRKLGQVALLLDPDPHDSTKPDLLGQSYRLLFNATFRTLLDNQADLARQLFPVTIALADRARARLLTDLAGQGAREQHIFGNEPLLDMMELSGYALLMSELDPPGIWSDVRDLWDRILAGDTAPALAAHLSAVRSADQNLFALTTGGIARTERQLALARMMSGRGISRPAGMLRTHPASSAGSAIVDAFAPNVMGSVQPELVDLFIVEYLKQRPDMTALEIPRGAERLRDALSRYRQRHAQASGTGGTE